MSKRVFIALKTTSGLRQEIENWQRMQGIQPVRWIKTKNLHITLIPPWYTDDVEHIKKLLDEVKGKTGPLLLKYNRITIGPTPREPRLIWMEGETPQAMTDLKSRLEKLLKLEPDRRKLRLHITLARFRPQDIKGSSLKNLDEKIEWEENVTELVLMESRLSPGGADYETLTEIPL